MHGGVLVDIADAAMGIAVMTTIELKMSFMRSHIKGRLVAEGTIAKRGRRIAFTEAVLTNVKKEILAKCNGTWLIMPA
ncbi:PaaI family thioesterase [Candidatus Bathyarchaeota archaeon]|nr:MAG: PaaI family thioesterase [Candidatus Bathyarchaeota archaeon]